MENIGTSEKSVTSHVNGVAIDAGVVAKDADLELNNSQTVETAEKTVKIPEENLMGKSVQSVDQQEKKVEPCEENLTTMDNGKENSVITDDKPLEGDSKVETTATEAEEKFDSCSSSSSVAMDEQSTDSESSTTSENAKSAEKTEKSDGNNSYNRYRTSFGSTSKFYILKIIAILFIQPVLCCTRWYYIPSYPLTYVRNYILPSQPQPSDIDFVGKQIDKNETPKRVLSDVAQYMVHFKIPTILHRYMPIVLHDTTCLGVLISNDYILSAAHCFHSMSTHAKAYFTDGSIVKFNKDRVLYNDNYPVTPGDKYSNDICIIHLPKTIERDPIDIYYRQRVRRNLTIIGLVQTNLLHPQAFPICLYKLNVESKDPCDTDRPDLEEKTICVETGGNKLRAGDSGGPLIHYEHKTPYLLGILSFDYEKRTPNQAAYTKLKYYEDWIQGILDRN